MSLNMITMLTRDIINSTVGVYCHIHVGLDLFQFVYRNRAINLLFTVCDFVSCQVFYVIPNPKLAYELRMCYQFDGRNLL